MIAKRIKLSNAIHAEFDFLENKELLFVLYDVNLTIYKCIGSNGGMVISEPRTLHVGLDYGATNWINYNFMKTWVEKMNSEADGSFVLLVSMRGSSFELEKFFEDNGGTTTLKEIREFEANKNIRKWENAPDPNPDIVYIGK
ncbi:TPA: hypothetical protein EYN09_05650 [Candidatus Poribacteria bacterium]|nr:hypothetical protein [Flavobacteriales bacterium]HIO06397.1 hypothetical protein [Candidatus Poribacteria bacterium]